MRHHIAKKYATLPLESAIFPFDGTGGWLESIRANFAANLKRLMKDRGLTGDQLADALSISSRSVYEWTRGKGLPKLDRLDDIAHALKTDFIELVRDPEVPLEQQLTLGFLREMARRLGHEIVKPS